ncbi:MAG TPA: hypothetical protein VKT51_11035 [Candidatus Eremiobacteraceae bacterium]|nr:hypothetical protein [Candidatus Eremiobacteraceae bacterium]
MTLLTSITRKWRFAAAALAIAVAAVAACGRGPVFPPTVSGPPVGSITFKFYVDLTNGSIAPSDGAYIIGLNINQGPNNVYGSPEQPGYPTFAEAQGLTYAHWDQELYYGTCPFGQNANGFCNPTLPANQFLYAFKAFTGGGSNTVKWLTITQNPPNSYLFFPNNSFSNGSGNAMQITIPITALNLRPSPTPIPGSSASPTPAPTPDNLYVQFFTVDTNGVPQDQMSCGLNSQDTIPNISLSVRKSYTFLACANKPGGGPSDQNLYIYGGEIDVFPLPGASSSPSPAPSPSPSA